MTLAYALKFYRCRLRWTNDDRPFSAPKKLIDWPVGNGCPNPTIERDLSTLYIIKNERRENQRRMRVHKERLIFKTRGIRLV